MSGHYFIWRALTKGSPNEAISLCQELTRLASETVWKVGNTDVAKAGGICLCCVMDNEIVARSIEQFRSGLFEILNREGVSLPELLTSIEKTEGMVEEDTVRLFNGEVARDPVSIPVLWAAILHAKGQTSCTGRSSR